MIHSRLRSLISQKEMRENRRITYREIAGATRIPASTISRLVGDQMTRFETDTLAALCKYFECNVGDILDYQLDEENRNAANA